MAKDFVIQPLPPKINWNNKLASTLSRADYLLGKLAMEGSKLPNPKILMRTFVIREAVLSSKIEGTNVTIGEILAYNTGAKVNKSVDELREVQNYIFALDYGLKSLKDLPLSLRLIKAVHLELMSGVRGENCMPGEFRTVQNWIGAPGCSINEAVFVPPPINLLPGCLGDFEKFLHDTELPPLIHIALCHYQFEAIHPFLDGNGRVGRLLISLLFNIKKILPEPLLYLSAFFEATRREYYDKLLNVTINNAWEDWFIYFLNGVAIQSEDALSRASRINKILTQWKMHYKISTSKMCREIIDCFAINPYLTIKQISQELEVAYSTAERGVKRLLDAKIILQDNTGKRDKLYCAKAILSILEEPAMIFSYQK